MVFPEFDRVIFGKNPLEEVICQLRFPTILRIEKDLPAEFQDRIREAYPNYAEAAPPDLAMGLPAEFQTIRQEFNIQPSSRSYKFASDDEQWTVTLTKDFIALATGKYETWGEFKSRLDHVVEAIVELYNPASYSRIGLRYKDVIQRKPLGLEGHRWAELLTPVIIGELASSDFDARVEHAARQLRMTLEPDDCKVNIRHGLGRNRETEETVFVVDADFYAEKKVAIDGVDDVLRYFNKESGNLFRSCIQETLYRAMEPSPA